MIVIVTGAASGIARELVTQLATAGHQVVATDVDAPSLQHAKQAFAWPDSHVSVERLDVTDPSQWQAVVNQTVQRYGQLDALVNVAGILRAEYVTQLKPESVALTLDVNVKGVILGTQAAAAVMVPRQAGRIINLASMAALAPVPGIAVYSASKFAVRGFSLAAAQELAPHGVHVSVLCPDAVDTPMVDYQLHHAEAALTFSGPRILTTAEVAQAIVRLLVGPPRLEQAIPWSRGVLAQASQFFPAPLRRFISNQLTNKGLAKQESLRRARESARSNSQTSA